MNRNNIYTVNPLYNGSTTQTTEDGSVQSGGTTIIYQQGGGTGLTDAQKQKLDGIQEGAEVNQNAYSKVRLNGSDTLIIEAKNKTDILNMSGVYPIAIAINGNGGLDFTVSSDQSNTNSVVTQSQLKAAIDQLEKDKYWKVDADGKLYTELDVYSHKEISAYGAGTGGGSTGGAGALYECADVLRDGDKVKGAEVGSVLSYNGTHWYAIPQSAIVPDLSGYATKSYVSQEINDLIGGAPGTLDTLKEIAEALGNDPNFATTITNMINNIGLRVDDIEARVVSLEDMFEWDKSASASDSSLWRIKAKRDLFGVGEISAYGYSAGTVPTGAQYLYELKDVQLTDLATGQLLQYNGSKWVNIDKNAVGLNETELDRYLTNNNYAKKTDITWANLLNKPTTWAWTDITGKPTTLAGYGITDAVISSRQVLAGNGLTGGGALTSDVTLSLNTIGTAGTYTKITTDQYGRVVSGTILSEGDIPTLQISKISGLQSALDSKLNISDFNTWFTINRDTSGNIVSIQANYDLFSVGEVSAYGLGGTQPSITMLAGLDDVNINNPQNKQALIYDSASGKWINGASVGGGNISLNGTVYKAVDGLITLPNLYEKVAGGTSSQFLKADGSVDGNLYALAYEGNKDTVFKTRYITVVDRRDEVIYPSSFQERCVTSYFSMQGTPTKQWYSVLSLKGWNSDYGTWQLAGPSSTDNTNNRPYYRDGKQTTWNAWKGLAFLDDVKNIADIYFNGQNIYSDYGHWVVGLIRIGTADIGYKYISGEMIYRRSNGIYGNGSVRFNLMKKYNSTQMFAGVFYTGHGIDPDQDAPRLCTFTYQGVKWGGLCWRSAASLNSIKTIIYDNSSTDTPFYVKYFNSQSSEIQNAEINNSISVLGSDIDVQPVSTNGRFYTYADRIEINNITNGWSYTRYRTNGRFCDVGLSGTTADIAEAGSFEIRLDGSNNRGMFVRYDGSSYGKLGVVSKNTQECSIGYFNSNNDFGDKPIWTVGAGLRDIRSFDWQYGTEGYKMTLMEDGKLFINRKTGTAPSYSLSIGDNDTGLNWQQDGMITFMSNSKTVGHWNYSEGRLYNIYFREPTGNGYSTTSMMVNGNGSDLYPGIGFHQPGVTAGIVYFTNSGEFKFRDINNNGYTNVYGGNLIAEEGYLYSRYNGIEIKIGSENSSYVHFITNPARSLYFANSLFVNGSIYADSYIETHGGLVCAGVGNSGGASGFNVYGSFYGNASHGGIEIGASDNVLGIGVHSNDSWYIWWTNSGSIGSSSNKSYIFSYNGSSWNFTGSVVASGEVTAYSDARLKSNIHTLDYRGRLIPRHYVKDGKQSIGFIAQEVQSLYPELVLGQDKNRPYLSLNYNGCTAVLSAQLNHVEDEVTMLKNKVRELEIKVSVLTEQLHSQAI